MEVSDYLHALEQSGASTLLLRLDRPQTAPGRMAIETNVLTLPGFEVPSVVQPVCLPFIISRISALSNTD